jgi:hypothetical protein
LLKDNNPLVKILSAEKVFDIIVGDFGRDASIEYLRLVSQKEKEVLQCLTSIEDCEFFDEYRLIMFALIANIGFLKQSRISEYIHDRRVLDQNVLIGLGASFDLVDFEKRLAFLVAENIMLAISNGYRRIRITLPCNTLSDLLLRVKALLLNKERIDEIRREFNSNFPSYEVLASATVSWHSVADAVVEQITLQGDLIHKSIVVLGTRGTNDLYKTRFTPLGWNCIELLPSHYELIDQTVVASIHGGAARIEECVRLLKEHIVRPVQKLHREVLILEACTDFHLGLGSSSLELLARHMISNCYGTNP